MADITSYGHCQQIWIEQNTAKRMPGNFVNKYRILTFVKRGVYCKPKPADTPTDNLDIDDFLQS